MGTGVRGWETRSTAKGWENALTWRQKRDVCRYDAGANKLPVRSRIGGVVAVPGFETAEWEETGDGCGRAARVKSLPSGTSELTSGVSAQERVYRGVSKRACRGWALNKSPWHLGLHRLRSINRAFRYCGHHELPDPVVVARPTEICTDRTRKGFKTGLKVFLLPQTYQVPTLTAHSRVKYPTHFCEYYSWRHAIIYWIRKKNVLLDISIMFTSAKSPDLCLLFVLLFY